MIGTRPEGPLPRGGTALLLLLLLAAILGTYRDYGISWDEGVQSTYGRLVVDYFRSGFSDTRCLDHENASYYGPLFEGAVEVAHRLSGKDLFELRHLLSALAMAGAVFAAVRFGRLAGVPGLPLFALLALAASPRFYGHGFINSKDIPFACAFTWAMVAVARFAGGRTGGRRAVAEVGLAVGAALAVRTGAFLLLFLLAAAILLRGPRPRDGDGRGRGTVFVLLGILAVAWAVMVLPWPAAHRSPLLFPFEALFAFARFEPAYPVLFAGETVMSTDLPRSYLLHSLAITTPPATALLALAGTGFAALRLVRGGRGRGAVFLGLLLLWLLAPLAYATIFRPNVYDGVRHFLFLFPAVALLAGYGAVSLIETAPVRFRGALRAGAALLLALPVRDIAELHPYEAAYFSPAARTVEEAMPRYESDYWATSYREAMEWVNRSGRPMANPSVLVAATEGMAVTAEHFREPHIRAAYGTDRLTPRPTLPGGFDFYVATTRYGFDLYFPEAPVLQTIGRRGMTFTVIKGTEETARLTRGGQKE